MSAAPAEQESIYDLAPNFDLAGYFTCGKCRGRKHPSQHGEHRGGGRYGAKWVICKKCMKQEQKNHRAARKGLTV